MEIHVEIIMCFRKNRTIYSDIVKNKKSSHNTNSHDMTIELNPYRVMNDKSGGTYPSVLGPYPNLTTLGYLVLHIILVTLVMCLQACIQPLKRIFPMRKVTGFLLYKDCF
jgi:hypothetical protein